MTTQRIIEGYETEIAYQKHMIANLGRWATLFFGITGIGVVLYSVFHESQPIVKWLAIVLFVIGLLGVLLFGYGIYKGRQNVQKVIAEFENILNN